LTKCGEFGGGGAYVPKVYIKLFWKDGLTMKINS